MNFLNKIYSNYYEKRVRLKSMNIKQFRIAIINKNNFYLMNNDKYKYKRIIESKIKQQEYNILINDCSFNKVNKGLFDYFFHLINSLTHLKNASDYDYEPQRVINQNKFTGVSYRIMHHKYLSSPIKPGSIT